MNELEKKKEIVALEKKLRSQTGGKDYVDSLRSLGLFELGLKLQDMAKYRQAVISTRESDHELKRAKNIVSGLNLPYTQDLTANAEKSRFLGLLMQEIEGFTPTQDLGEEGDS